eukprot:3567135-Amphidinium_carterae.1
MLAPRFVAVPKFGSTASFKGSARHGHDDVSSCCGIFGVGWSFLRRGLPSARRTSKARIADASVPKRNDTRAPARNRVPA